MSNLDNIADQHQPKGVNDLIERQRQRLHETLHVDAVAFRRLREIMGFTQNGSNVTVRLNQDECTKDYSVSVGDDPLKAQCYHNDTLYEAIARAHAVHKQD